MQHASASNGVRGVHGPLLTEQRRQGRRARPRAFTLLELLIVVSLIGVLALFVWPDYGSASRGRRLEETQRRFEAAVTMCRAQAANEGRRYRLRFLADGSVQLQRQVDPLIAPHEYEAVHDPWAQTPLLLDAVWVEAVQLLPDGPAPVMIVNDEIRMPELDQEPVAVDEFDRPPSVIFMPDGSCGSLRWVLRSKSGHGTILTLDGRLGVVKMDGTLYDPPDEVKRPSGPGAEDEEPKR